MSAGPVSVPDVLLAPLLDTAADVLRDLEAEDAPVQLRRLLGWDRRGLTRSTARAQIRRAIEDDPAFAERVTVRLLERPDVQAVAAMVRDGAGPEGTAPERAGPERAVRVGAPIAGALRDLERRGELPLLVSYLFATRLVGFELGLGAAVAMFEMAAARESEDAERTTARARIAELEEAHRRDEAALARQSAELARLEAELREERQSRRGREAKAAAEVTAAEEQLVALSAELSTRQEAVAAERERAGREASRARAAEEALREARLTVSALEAQLADTRSRRSFAREQREALLDAAATAEELAQWLLGLVDQSGPAPRPATRVGDRVVDGDGEGAGPGVQRGGRGDPPAAGSASPTRLGAPASRRAPVPIPPGMLNDTPAAIDEALRAGRVAVVIDGYNLAMREWPGEPPSEQRERLIALAANLKARVRNPVTVVFDGSDLAGPVSPRRSGVRVLFSAPGETADDVVVREVAATPLETPVIAVSSDKELRRRVGAHGALAVPVESFSEVLRG